MEIVVVDGQGGGIGKALVEQIKRKLPEAKVVAAGANALATAAMLKAGADAGATGENAVIYNCKHAKIIAGPLGIVLANAMRGEITPKIARAAAESEAVKFLVPVLKCQVHVAGIQEQPVGRLVEAAVSDIGKYAFAEENK